ncbi:MAG: hypothetical protein JXL80_16820 [Planctomycetes bacterium]|nr:hypothetical protein [Planctomycetota bacterium]
MNRSSWDAVRRVLRSDPMAEDLSSEETAMLVSQLTDLVGRVDRVRALGPAFADLSVSQNVQDLLARLEVGSGLQTGVH